MGQKLKRILESVVCLDKHPRTKIQVNFEILSTESDFSTLICHMINLGAYIFLESGVSTKDIITASVVGMNEEGNEYILDPTPLEKSKSEFNLTVGSLSTSGDLSYFKTEGKMLSGEEGHLKMEEGISLAVSACNKVSEKLISLCDAA